MSIYCRGGGDGRVLGSHMVFSGKEGGRVNRRQQNTMIGGGDYRD